MVAANDAPVAVDDARGTDEDTSLTVVAPGVLGNDTDAEDDSLTVGEVNGSVLDVGVEITLASGAQAHPERRRLLHLRSQRPIRGPPQRRAIPTRSPTRHPTAWTIATEATVTITITGVNDAPVAVDDTGTTDEDSALLVSDPGVLGNDTDAEGDTLTVAEVNGVVANVGPRVTLTSGALLTLNADGSYTYDPNGQFESLDDGQSDTDSFTYKANDGDADSNEATVMITINGVNDAPVAVGRHRHHDEDRPCSSLIRACSATTRTPRATRSRWPRSTCGRQRRDRDHPHLRRAPTLNADGSYTYDPNGQFEDLERRDRHRHLHLQGERRRLPTPTRPR